MGAAVPLYKGCQSRKRYMNQTFRLVVDMETAPA